jgi:hypothetical protein
MITIHHISTLQDVRDFLHEIAQEIKFNKSTFESLDNLPVKGYTESQYRYRNQLLAQCWTICNRYEIDLDILFKKIIDKYD